MSLYYTSDGPEHDSNPPPWVGCLVYVLACIIIAVCAWVGLGR